jgi:hypothetical protein
MGTTLVKPGLRADSGNSNLRDEKFMKPSIWEALEGAKLVDGKIVLITGAGAALDANGGSLMI